jgi:hypothetical protein
MSPATALFCSRSRAVILRWHALQQQGKAVNPFTWATNDVLTMNGTYEAA